MSFKFRLSLAKLDAVIGQVLLSLFLAKNYTFSIVGVEVEAELGNLKMGSKLLYFLMVKTFIIVMGLYLKI